MVSEVIVGIRENYGFDLRPDDESAGTGPVLR
jgi:hypothetical protein